jgi:hypothetical protein
MAADRSTAVTEPDSPTARADVEGVLARLGVKERHQPRGDRPEPRNGALVVLGGQPVEQPGNAVADLR